jgi:hypothetical protein
MSDQDGRCPECGEDEMDGARCYYCGFHDYICDIPDCSWCRARLPTPEAGESV